MRSILFIALMCHALFSFAQEQDNTKTNRINNIHEVRLDGLKLIAGPVLEGSYEFVRNPNSGFGMSLLVNLNSENEFPENFSLTPFYRMYFFNKKDYGAKGFFVEGFGKMAVVNDYDILDEFENDLNSTDFSLGMSLGNKWVNSNGFVFEVLFGVSRSLSSNAKNEAYVRGGLFVGYRF